MKRIASPLALSLLVSSPSYADSTYTDQTLTKTVEIDSTGINGKNGDNNGSPDAYGGASGADLSVQFVQSSAGPGNRVTTTGDGVHVSSTGGNGGYPGSLGSYGGYGGSGGHGGALSVGSSGTLVINASGGQAHGIQAISVGGAGIDGNDSNGNNYVGGEGGTGGAGGAVSIDLGAGAALTTNGIGSNAILAQSLGGSSGDNGSDYSNTGSGQQYDGPTGGQSGLVTVEVAQGVTLQTYGANSYGIAASSISGNGGAGGNANGGFGTAYGGQGGNGGTSGGIAITSGANITTGGAQSAGIVGQAMSGGGGRGGNADALLSTVAGGPGKGGVVNAIDIANSGSIRTSGFYSQGILAQSVSGGGGVAGSASGSLFYDAGGSAADNNNAGTITVTHAGQWAALTTTGDNSQGILAQSIGGGGGVGGAAGGMIVVDGGQGGVGGSGGDVLLTLSAPIQTSGMSSHGAAAQSIGGGGGLGGVATGVGAQVSTAVGGTGGQGGSGGNPTIAMQNGQVTTNGTAAIGILAQSVGGGGGAGGGAYTTSAGMLLDVAVAVGGQGGAGGNGGNANVTLSNAYVHTAQAQASLPQVDSMGIAVQSIGGGGGVGGNGNAAGYAIAIPLPSDDPQANVTFAGAVAVGGAGGSGGKGGSAQAQIDNGSLISTGGAGANGLLIQSLGGGGGNGGDSSTLAASVGYGVPQPFDSSIAPVTNAVNISVSVGGTGGGGGAGGSAELLGLGDNGSSGSASSTIGTTGADAVGALVQSIGGGGGNAGVGNAKVASYATNQSLDLRVTVGSAGGSGGTGGSATATVNALGNIVTSGASAEGLLVQSIGGGGGVSSGGSVDLSGLANWVRAVSALPSDDDGPPPGITHTLTIGVGNVGAKSAVGGNGGAATATNLGAIITTGVDAPAILVQSIGGGGGVGGSMVGAPSMGNSVAAGPASPNGVQATNSTPVSAKSTLNLGGGWGNGGAVTVTHSGTIATGSDYSSGIIAQSVGAGGGKASAAILGVDVGGALSKALSSASSPLNVTNNITVGFTDPKPISISGDGMTDGGASTVNLNSGSITTGGAGGNGFQSFGVLAQSVGGGGGIAADGTSGPYGSINMGVLAGSANNGLTGSGGEFGSGTAAVISDQSNTGGMASAVTTNGDAAHGLFAQSVGGGGGIVGAGSSQTPSGGGGARYMTIGLGAGTVITNALTEPGDFVAGNGGDATVALQTTPAVVITSGNGAFGVLAQSVGGGGGTVAIAPGTGTTIDYLGSQAFPDVSVYPSTYQNLPGSGSNATVKIMNAASLIMTGGVGAHGVMAQSVGGGGGLVANYRAGTTPTMSSSLATLSKPGNAFGLGGNVEVSSYGSISTTGNGAFGILAQSIGGGGGLVVSDDGAVFAGATGTDSNSTGGAVSIDVHSFVTTTGVNSNGIWAQSTGSGGGNTITITLADAANVIGGSGQGVGIMVDGGNGSNTITLSDDASYLSSLSGVAIKAVNGGVNVTNHGNITGSTLLGSWGTLSAAQNLQASGYTGGRLTNFGSLVATPGQRSVIEGDLVQAASGRIVPHLDYSNGVSGQYVVTGAAALDGTIEPTLASAMPNRYLPVLTTKGPTSGTLRAPDSPLFAYTLRQTGIQRDIAITGTHFNAPELGLNQHKGGVARTLENVFASGNAELGPFFASLDAAARADLGSYRDAIGELSPRSTMTLLSRVAADASRIADASMSCPEFASGAAQAGSILVEGECAYLTTRGNITTLSADADRAKSRLKSFALQGGGQREVRPGLLFGGSLAYQADDFSSRADGVTAKGNSVQGAVTLKQNQGAWQASAALFGNYGQYDTKRRIAMSGYSATATGDVPMYSVGLRGRVAYTAGTEQLYLRPSVNVDLIHAGSGSYAENGAGDLGLKVASSTYNTAILTPEIEIGNRHDLKSGGVLRSFALVGISVRSNDDWRGRASFRGGEHTPSFHMQAPLDQVALRLGAGVQLFANERVDVHVRYDAELGSEAKSHNATAKFAYRF